MFGSEFSSPISLSPEEFGGKQHYAQCYRSQRKQPRALEINEKIFENRRSQYQQAIVKAHCVTFPFCRVHSWGQANAFFYPQY